MLTGLPEVIIFLYTVFGQFIKFFIYFGNFSYILIIFLSVSSSSLDIRGLFTIVLKHGISQNDP